MHNQAHLMRGMLQECMEKGLRALFMLQVGRTSHCKSIHSQYGAFLEGKKPIILQLNCALLK